MLNHDQPVNEVSQDGAAALHRRLLPGHHHIVLICIMTAHIQGGNGNALHLHIGIWHSKNTDTLTLVSTVVSKLGRSLITQFPFSDLLVLSQYNLCGSTVDHSFITLTINGFLLFIILQVCSSNRDLVTF